MSGLILIVCRNSNIRRFCVDNLVTRGYLAVGVASVDEGKEILKRHFPNFVMLCCEPRLAEDEIQKIRHDHARLIDVPLVMVSMERPDRVWMNKWNVAAQFPYPIDARRLIDLLMPWLDPNHREQMAFTEMPQSKQM
jgi:DNA-binding NtrC family response regulator